MILDYYTDWCPLQLSWPVKWFNQSHRESPGNTARRQQNHNSPRYCQQRIISRGSTYINTPRVDALFVSFITTRLQLTRSGSSLEDTQDELCLCGHIALIDNSNFKLPVVSRKDSGPTYPWRQVQAGYKAVARWCTPSSQTYFWFQNVVYSYVWPWNIKAELRQRWSWQ